MHNFVSGNQMDILQTFLKLTSRTYPHKTESDLFYLLPQGIQEDEFGNKFLQIGDSPSTMFTSHLDTATNQLRVVNHVLEDGFVKTDGNSILGADDKAGVVILLSMIEAKIEGLYYFFIGEEVGCIGSKLLSDKHRKNPIPYIKKVVSFDRRGYDSIITHQMGQRCCSDFFAQKICDGLNSLIETFSYKIDPSGIYTDSAQFIDIYPECTNISVGYFSEHTKSEIQNIEHLENLCQASIGLNWQNLPTERDPFGVDFSNDSYPYVKYSKHGHGMKKREIDYDYYDYYDTILRSDLDPLDKTNSSKFDQLFYGGRGITGSIDTRKIVFYDTESNNYITTIETDPITNKVIRVELGKKRMEFERKMIIDFLDRVEIKYIDFEWDGVKLLVIYLYGNETITHRSDLSNHIPCLDFWREYSLELIVKDQRETFSM